MNTLRRRLIHFGIACVAIGFMFGCFEATFRLWFVNFGTEEDRIRYVYTTAQLEQIPQRFRGQPFLNYGLAEDFPTHNRLGYRGRIPLIPKPHGIFRIVTLGGSSTYGDGIAEGENTYPAQLERILREEYGLNQVEVINAGVPGYSSWEILVDFSFRILDLEPDLIIFYEGVNDIFPRLVAPQDYTGLISTKGLWKTERPTVPLSTFYRYIALQLGWMDDPNTLDVVFAQEFATPYCDFNADYSACTNMDFTPSQLLAENPPIYFERNISSLVAIATQNNIPILFSTWAYFPDPLPEKENFMVHAFAQNATAEHNALLKTIAERAQHPLFDLADALPYNSEYWIDGIHLTPLGTYQQALLYATYLIENQLIP